MDNRYNRHNRRKYSLKVYIVLVTKYRKQILKGSIADVVKQNIYDICNSKGYGIIAMETDKDHIHFLISYDTTDRVCDIVKLIKQQATFYLWQKYSNFLSKCYWKHKIFWSDGYFACSIGEVSSATIQKYIESQGLWIRIYKAPPTAQGQWVSAYDNERILFMNQHDMNMNAIN